MAVVAVLLTSMLDIWNIGRTDLACALFFRQKSPLAYDNGGSGNAGGNDNGGILVVVIIVMVMVKARVIA
jgi:hypothetical protein